MKRERESVMGAAAAVAVVALLGGALLFACDTWKAADARSASDAAKLEALLEARCSPAVVDAGSCDPAAVRALERGAYCANASMLGRRGLSAPDAGIRCRP